MRTIRVSLSATSYVATALAEHPQQRDHSPDDHARLEQHGAVEVRARSMARSALVAVSPESAAVRIASVIAFAWVGSRPASVRRRAMVRVSSIGSRAPVVGLWVANYYSARNPLRLSSLVILGVVARMFRCATRSSCWCT